MLSEGFEILKLPNSSERTQEAVPAAAPGQRLYLGISHSSISTVSLAPPRVESAFSVSPDAVVTAVAARSQSEIAFISNERSKCTLRLVSGESVPLDTSSSHLVYTGSVFSVLFEDHTVCAFDGRLNKLWQSTLLGTFAGTRRPKSESKSLLYSTVVEKGAIAVVVPDLKKDTITLYLVEASPEGLALVKSSPLAIEGKKLMFSYQDGILYCCNSLDNRISMISVASGQVIKSFQITGSSISQITALERQNIIVAQGSLLTLVDCHYVAQIAQRTYPELQSIVAYVHPSSTLVAVVGKSITAINITTSRSTLLEAIGRGIQHPDAITGGFCDLLPTVAQNVSDFHKPAMAVLQAAQTEFETVVADLEKDFASANANALRRLVTYCQEPSSMWTTLKVLEDPAVPSIYNHHDRQVDCLLIQTASKQAFGFSVSGKPISGPLSWVPKHVLFYLLSHPLFPSADPEFVPLLSLLTDPHMYRQAIVSMPYCRAHDLLGALLSADSETFIDAAIRLREDYPPDQIRNAAREAFAASQNSANVAKLVNRLSKHTETWPIISPFIDAVGLLSWSPGLLSKVRVRLARESEELEAQAGMDTVLKELLRSANYNIREKIPGDHILHTEPEWRARKVHVKPSRENTVAKLPLYSIEKLVIS